MMNNLSIKIHGEDNNESKKNKRNRFLLFRTRKIRFYFNASIND